MATAADFTSNGLLGMMDGYPTNHYDNGILSITVKVRAVWANAENAKTYLLSTSYPGSPGAECHYVSYEKQPGQTSGAAGICEYDYAVLTCIFSTRNMWNVTETFTPSAQFQKNSIGGLRWTSTTGQLLDHLSAPWIRIASMTYTRSWAQFSTAALHPDLLEKCGYVNDGVVVTNEYIVESELTFGDQTLLYIGSDIRFENDIFFISAKFNYKPSGWNKFLKLGTTGGATTWAEVFGSGSAHIFYPKFVFQQAGVSRFWGPPL